MAEVWATLEAGGGDGEATEAWADATDGLALRDDARVLEGEL